MRITEIGDRKLPPLVLLHGLGSTPRCWERNLDALARHHRLLLVDLFAQQRGDFTLEEVAVELAERVPDDDMAVMGHSMGGLLALHLAARAASRVSRLVLVATPALRVPRRRFAQLRAVASSSVRRDATAAGIVLSCVLRTSPMLLLAATRATLAADLGREAFGAAVPTLLVWGADDAIVPVEVGHALAAHMPAARLVVLPRAGHQPMWEVPGPFNAAISRFLTAPG